MYFYFKVKSQEEFDDTKVITRICKSKNNKRSTKHTQKTKDRVTSSPLKTGGELKCSGRVSSSFSTSGTRRVVLVTNP
jgi:hypothetical protein